MLQQRRVLETNDEDHIHDDQPEDEYSDHGIAPPPFPPGLTWAVTAAVLLVSLILLLRYGYDLPPPPPKVASNVGPLDSVLEHVEMGSLCNCSGDDPYDQSCFHERFEPASLIRRWDALRTEGVIRPLLGEDTGGLPTRFLEWNGYRFGMELNEGRGKSRRKDLDGDIGSPASVALQLVDADPIPVVQEFNSTVWNFRRIQPSELMAVISTPETPGKSSPTCLRARDGQAAWIANVHPIARGHGLLVPQPHLGLPQVLQYEALVTALRVCRELEASGLPWRVGFNSLGACASVNHLHFQPMPMPEFMLTHQSETGERVMPIEVAPSQMLKPHIHRLRGYAVEALVFERQRRDVPERWTDREMAAAIIPCVQTLQQDNRPHTLLLTDHGQRVFLVPRRFEGGGSYYTIRPGWLETMGGVVVVDKAAYEWLSGEAFWNMLRTKVSVEGEVLDQLIQQCV